MGVTFSHFEIGRRALRAGQLGMSVAGQNIANVNTAGYSRQGIQLSPTPADSSNLRFTGNGVQIDGVQRFRDRFIDSRLQTESGINGRLTARRDALAPVEAALTQGVEGGGIGASMNKFFGAFRDLEANPTSVPLRAAVAGQGAALADAFHATNTRLDNIRRDSVEAIESGVEDVNRLAASLADYNVKVGVAEGSGGNAHELRDSRAEVARQLSELTGARSIENLDGSLTLTLADGRPLVIGDKAYKLEAVTTPGTAPTFTLDGEPAVVGDGRLRGLVDAVASIDAHTASLDSLAASVVARTNTLHASGSDLDGANGTNFFNVPANAAPVTAKNINVSAAVLANPRLVVAGANAAGTGDASIARSIANLLTDNTSVVGTRTVSFSAHFASVVSEAGAQVRLADDSLATQSVILAQVTAQRDAVSGVSLDEEAINLLQSQKAYEAAARFLRIADEMTQTIIALGQ